jgi:hypothetical protein
MSLHLQCALACACAAAGLAACNSFAPKPPPTIIGAPVATQRSVVLVPTAGAQLVQTPAPLPTEASPLVAKVNDDAISVTQFNTEMLRYLGDVAPDSDDGRKQIEQLKPLVLRELIQRALIRQEAGRQSLTIKLRWPANASATKRLTTRGWPRTNSAPMMRARWCGRNCWSARCVTR